MLVVDATFNFAVSQIQSTAHISRTKLRTKSGLHEHAIDKQAKIESMKLLGELNFELAATHDARTVFDIGIFLVRMQKNADLKNSEYGHFSRSV